MRRLAFLSLAIWAGACAAPRPPAPAAAPAAAPATEPAGAAAGAVMSAAIPREQTADQQVTHALNRLAFGPRPGDVEAVRRMGLDAWIDRQLHPERIDDTALDQFLAATYHVLGDSPAELERRYPPPGQLINRAGARNGLSHDDSVQLRESQMGIRQMSAEVQGARVARAVLTERQLLEVMTDFWLNHFTVYDAKGPRERYMLADYENRVIRPNALGKFRTLLGSVAKSEAMLFYLDNWESQADSTRPRLAPMPGRGGRRGGGFLRGGMPTILPAMGAQPPAQLPAQIRKGGLNENYGRELLELHTLGVDGGYTQADVINAARALTGWTFKGPQQGGGFQFVPFMHDAGEKVVLGHTLKAGRGIEDGEDLLDIVARHPSTAHYIAFKLARRFVSDSPSTALVDRAAATFTRTGGDIRETLRTIIMSPEFFSRAAYRSKVKSPFEVVVSAARALGAHGDATPRTAQLVAQLGEPIYGHQAPNGWPETGDQWMNTGAILNRINFGMLMAAGRVPGASPFGFEGAAELRSAPVNQQVDGVVAHLLGGDVSPEMRAVLVSGSNPLSRSSPAGDPRPQLKGLPLIVGLALGSPEFQRR